MQFHPWTKTPCLYPFRTLLLSPQSTIIKFWFLRTQIKKIDLFFRETSKRKHVKDSDLIKINSFVQLIAKKASEKSKLSEKQSSCYELSYAIIIVHLMYHAPCKFADIRSSNIMKQHRQTNTDQWWSLFPSRAFSLCHVNLVHVPVIHNISNS